MYIKYLFVNRSVCKEIIIIIITVLIKILTDALAFYCYLPYMYTFK